MRTDPVLPQDNPDVPDGPSIQAEFLIGWRLPEVSRGRRTSRHLLRQGKTTVGIRSCRSLSGMRPTSSTGRDPTRECTWE